MTSGHIINPLNVIMWQQRRNCWAEVSSHFGSETLDQTATPQTRCWVTVQQFLYSPKFAREVVSGSHSQLWFSCFFLVFICVHQFQTSFARLLLEHVNEVFCHRFNWIFAFTIWQTTITQNTEGTAEEEDVQPSCRDDHDVKKERIRIPYTNYIQPIQKTETIHSLCSKGIPYIVIEPVSIPFFSCSISLSWQLIW